MNRRDHTRRDAPECGFAFAPQVIEHHRRPMTTPAQRRALAVWAQRVALLFAAVTLVSFAAGYISSAV